MCAVNNLANGRPPIDANNNSWTFYDVGIYNAYGRSLQLELSVDR
ncbi:hypothetical protein [Xanthomonas sp.]|nr:hypothetical protein [Xanthomonas sp.]